MAPASAPVIEPLNGDWIQSILARNHVGRLVFSGEGELEIRPLHYVYSQGSIYCRTTPDAKVAATPGPRKVVFEVDEIEAVFRWKSVIVRGECHVLSRDGEEGQEWDRASELLRHVVKRAFEADDPVPLRTTILKIEVGQATGMTCA